MPHEEKKSKGWFLALPYIYPGVRRPSRLEKMPPHLRDSQSIFCDDVLLSGPNWRECLKDWLDGLATGGRMVLWVSDVRYIEPLQGQQRLTMSDLMSALVDTGPFEMIGVTCPIEGRGATKPNGPAPSHSVIEADIVDGHAFIVIEKTQWGKDHDRRPWRKAEKHALVIRTGAHGDALMAASVLPGLKDDGYRITFMTAKRGHEVLQNDPHIDEFLVLGDGFVDDAELGEFWSAWSPRFDRVINFMQTVEGRFLKQSHRPDFWWSDRQRRAMCGGSYLQFAHQAAEVSGPYRVKFYPTAEERVWAQKAKEQNGKLVVWCIQGSAVHKWWPYVPHAICQLLAKTDYNFVLCGDNTAHDLANAATQAVIDYVGPGAASRLKSAIANRSIREVMALAQHADIVIGPETGVLNAVSMEENAKIVLLSHSAPSNLTDDWVNTRALVPTSPCYPCHRLHYSHDYCPQDRATEAAACAASITVEAVVNAVLAAGNANSILQKPDLKVVAA